MFKFLPAVFFIQAITAGLVLIALKWSHDAQLVIVITMIAAVVGLLGAFWYAAIARDIQQEKLAQLYENHAQEREEIRVSAEREKVDIIAQSYQKIEQETRKAHAKANFKVGAAFTLAAGAGAAMLLTQFVTIGLMVLVGSGTGLAGYLARARQERLARKSQQESYIEHEPDAPRITKQ